MYFLFRGKALTYTGKSRDVYARIRSHRCNGRQFDYWLVAPCDEAQMDWIETALIQKLEPRENKAKVRRAPPKSKLTAADGVLPPDPDMLVTRKGAMDYARFFRKQGAVSAALISGELPSRRDRLGRAWIIRVGDLRDWLKKQL